MGMFILGMLAGMAVMAFIAAAGKNNKEHDAWCEGYNKGLEDGMDIAKKK